MRASLGFVVALVVAAPASAGTWRPPSSFGTGGHVAVGPGGTTLIGWPTWNDDAERSEVRYRRVADDGSFGPEIPVGSGYGSRFSATGRGSAGSTVIDGDGDATLIFGFLDESDYGGDTDCCYRYETALLPQGAQAAVARRRIEPAGRDRTGLRVAVTPGGARVGAWSVVRPRRRNQLIQVLDAPDGRGFGRPSTIADEPVQSQSDLRVVAERGGAAWVLWATERNSRGRLITAVRAARRHPGKRRWNVRTIARRTDPDGNGLRIDDWYLHAAAGREGELLVGWDECDGDRRFGPASCRIRVRWRRSGAWGRAQTVSAGGVSTGGWGLAMDRRGRAVVAFDACERSEDGTVTDECTLQLARGRGGRLEPASYLGPGGFVRLAANRRGHVMLLYETGRYGEDYARYARAGSITNGFGPAERLEMGYMTSCCGHGVDDRGNFSFTFGGYEGGTYLLRYRR